MDFYLYNKLGIQLYSAQTTSILNKYLCVPMACKSLRNALEKYCKEISSNHKSLFACKHGKCTVNLNQSN